eukprot:907200-Amphidinium_carterae.1
MTTGDFVPPIAEIATGFMPIALDARMGKLPDPAIVKPLASQLREAQDLYRVNLARSRMSEDFQGIEFYKQTEAMVMKRMGMNLEQLHAGVEWQMGGMLAYAEGRLPPARPEGQALLVPNQAQGVEETMKQELPLGPVSAHNPCWKTHFGNVCKKPFV